VKLTKKHIGDRTFIYRKTERGWDIIVMPDRLQIDSYYHRVHIHSDKAELRIKDPKNPLYTLDLDDWIYHLEHPEAKIEQENIIFLKDTNLKMSDLQLLNVIKKEHLNSIRNLSHIYIE